MRACHLAPSLIGTASVLTSAPIAVSRWILNIREPVCSPRCSVGRANGRYNADIVHHPPENSFGGASFWQRRRWGVAKDRQSNRAHNHLSGILIAFHNISHQRHGRPLRVHTEQRSPDSSRNMKKKWGWGQKCAPLSMTS
jgi:hypothetical protein